MPNSVWNDPKDLAPTNYLGPTVLLKIWWDERGRFIISEGRKESWNGGTYWYMGLGTLILKEGSKSKNRVDGWMELPPL